MIQYHQNHFLNIVMFLEKYKNNQKISQISGYEFKKRNIKKYKYDYFFSKYSISGVGQHGKIDGMIMILNFQISKI